MWPFWLLFTAVVVGHLSVAEKSRIDCGFEDVDICGYTYLNDGGTGFVRHSGKSLSRTLSSFAGITSSSEGAWYVYVVCKTSPTWGYGSLTSPEEQPVYKKCLQFSYNMYGGTVYILKVYLKTALGWGDAIWIQHSNQGEGWHTASIPITSFQPFQIVFQVHIGKNTNCDIAVDDVRLVDCPNEVLNGSETLEPWTEWKKCDQSCGANYRSRARFWFSRESKQPFDFTYHIRYSTADKLCPEEHRWYFDDLEDGTFKDEHGKAQATVTFGPMNASDPVLAIKTGQEGVKISFPRDSCVFGNEECADGFTLSYWINLRSSQGGACIISSASNNGLKVTLVNANHVNIVMDTAEKQWSMNTSVTALTWTYVTITWSACHGLTYYENGHVIAHSGVFKSKAVDGSAVDGRVFYIGKSASAVGAKFSMLELVIWNGMLSPRDIKALSRKADQNEKFMFLKTSQDSLLQWIRSSTNTPSENTGPSHTHVYGSADENDDVKPSSCEDIKSMDKGDVDGYYVIYPRGACGDSFKVWCRDMSGSSPKEYVDVDPAVNYGLNAGLDPPCQEYAAPNWKAGKTSFNKIRVLPDTLVVDQSDKSFANDNFRVLNFGSGGACYKSTYDATCSHSGNFSVNLRNTSIRVKPAVNWHGSGWWDAGLNLPFMVNFRRSADNREISANCGGWCGHCSSSGDIILELATCVEKKPRSCADVKYYRNTNRDGNYTIYPYPLGLSPLRVYCAGMRTADPAEYINVLHDESKNFALIHPAVSYGGTCKVNPSGTTVSHFRDTTGHSRFSKIRVDISNMEVIRTDHRFAYNVFGINISYAHAASCFSWVVCMPLGRFNVDLTGTGLKIKPSVSWNVLSWPAERKRMSTIHKGFYGQIIDATCGAYCGRCEPGGSLYLELVGPYNPEDMGYFGEKNLSLAESTDEGKSVGDFDFSEVCSVAVGMEDGRIPDSSFAVSSYHVSSVSGNARLHHSSSGWRAKDNQKKPWLQVDLIFVRLVTGFATHAGPGKYLKTYQLSFGFNPTELALYTEGSNQPKIFVRTVAGTVVVKEVLAKPFFARYVRFTILTWNSRARLAAEIYACPRATFHHVFMSDHFYFLESSYPGAKGERGELVTRTMPPVYTCMQFKYHMYGSDMGRLDVYIEEMNRSRQLAWSVVGEQDPHAWKKAAIPLTVDSAFRMIFVGAIGNGFKSDMAVGDVSLVKDENCTFSPSSALPGPSCVPTCGGRSKCDNVTGKCLCLDGDFVDEKCQNELLTTLYKDAIHYWSFDDPENLTDLMTGVKATVIKPVAHAHGPVNLALTTFPSVNSGLDLGHVRYPCLTEPSVCPGGFTISAWIKPDDPGDLVSFFNTNPGKHLGVALSSYSGVPKLAFGVQGTKHKCWRTHWLRFATWSFVAVTWSIESDGSGKLVFYLFDDNGMRKQEGLCVPMNDLSFLASTGRMLTRVQQTVGGGYSLDELAVWDSPLSEGRVMEIYNIVTRNSSNSIVWKFKLKSYRWNRNLVDEESAKHEEEKQKINELIPINNGSITKIWDEFESDRCIYAGSVRGGVVTWRKDTVLHCNDTRFKHTSEHMNLKLHVKNEEVGVKLDNVILGSVPNEAGSTTARVGFFGTTEEHPDELLMKNFHVDAREAAKEFTFQDCDGDKSGATGGHGEYALYGTQAGTITNHCMAIYERPMFSPRYHIKATLRHEKGVIKSNKESGHMGILLKYENKKNFVLLIIRTHLTARCFTFSQFKEGISEILSEDTCPGGLPNMRAWHTLSISVDLTTTHAHLDGSPLFSEKHTHSPQPSRVGVVVYYRDQISMRFKDFRVVEDFGPITGLPNHHVFQLPSINDTIEDHDVTLLLGEPVPSNGSYTVSADLYFTTGGFGMAYNVVDINSTFDFVYYRRNRGLFTELIQSVLTPSWKQNELLQKEIENSSLVFLSSYSRKVPTHKPFNVSSFAINSTALNLSWSWDPDYDVTGLFQGFKVVYKSEEDVAELWTEKVIHGREFENSSWVILNDLRKSMVYFMKVVAFSLVGDGFPSQEIRNATMDDIPGMIALNVTSQNVDLQSVRVKWDLLPKYYWNGGPPGYIVIIQDILHGTNVTVRIPAGTTQLTHTELKHFTNYSVSLMAVNNVGRSQPTIGGVIETLEHVPATYPSNLSARAINTSALTVSWSAIDRSLWNGMAVGYVIYCSRNSKYQRNFTVPFSTMEINITNLTAFTFYNVTIAGFTRKGLGPKHPLVTVRTHEEVPRIAPVNLRILNQTAKQDNNIHNNVTNVTSSIPKSYSTTLEWDPIPDDQVRGVVRGYMVTYGPVELYYITRARRSLPDPMHAVSRNTSTASIELDNLLFYANYSAEVRAYTVDNGVPSSVFHFTTPEGVPAEGPGNLYASHKGSKSKLSVKWEDVPVNARNGILLGYHVYYHETSSRGFVKNKTVTTTYVTLTGLETYTSYDIRICGFTRVGDGACSETTAYTRAHDIAPYTAPWNATTVRTSLTSITLVWKPFPYSLWYEYPRGYLITFQRVALGGLTTSGDEVQTVKVGYKTGSYSWSGLGYYTKYKIEISTITYRGFGPKSVLYADTCECPAYMTTTFQILPPYVMRKGDKVHGILPEIIQKMTSSCCTSCGGTVVDFEKDGLEQISEKGTYPELSKSLSKRTTFAFPIVGYPDTDTYGSHFGFIPGVESPGMVVIVKKQSTEKIALTVMKAIFGIWPILLINIMLALVAGIVMWILDSSSNEEIFPRTCIHGCLMGFWWAFISMTTVGYGDTTAKSVPARVFAVIWILTGLCLYSILIGDLSSALSATVSVSETSLYGAKVAVLTNSSVESVAIRRNAKVVGGPYHALPELQKAVLSGKVDAALLDIYIAGLTKELWNHTDLRISKILDYSAPYGIVLAGGTQGIQRCFQSYVHDNRIKILDLVVNYTQTLKGIKREETLEYVQDLIDGQSPVFRQTLLILCISFGVLVLLGIAWNFTCRIRRSVHMKKDNAVYPEKMSYSEVLKGIKATCLDITSRLEAMKKRHDEEIRRLKVSSGEGNDMQ